MTLTIPIHNDTVSDTQTIHYRYVTIHCISIDACTISDVYLRIVQSYGSRIHRLWHSYTVRQLEPVEV